MEMGEIESGDTFTDAWNTPEWLIMAILGAALIGVFKAGTWFERRGQGPVTAQQAVAGASESTTAP
jgi:hypothetical protein